MRTFRDILDAVADFFGGMSRRKISTYSAAGTYYLFVSLVPMIMLCCAILQYTPLTEETVMDVVSEYVPDSLYQVVERIVAGVYSGGRVALTVSIVLTLWSASASMRALMQGMDAVYDAERRENYFIFILRACLYMLIFLAMLLLSLFVMVYGGRILQLVRSYLPVSPWLDHLFQLLRYLRFLVAMAILTVIFSMLYRWMPAVHMRYRHQWPGAVFSAVTWVAFSSVFSFYVSFSDKFGAYGFLGTILVAMMWMYFCIYFLLIGGFINRYIDLRRNPENHREHPSEIK